jgi:predicted SnoaL-like aldol condensation-catalyzing enzyme
MVQMFATGDVGTVAETISEAYRDHQGMNGNDVVGQDGFVRVVKAARQMRDLELRVEDMFAEGDRAVVRIRWRGVLNDGRRVERETIDIVRVADGRAVEHWGTRLSEY